MKIISKILMMLAITTSTIANANSNDPDPTAAILHNQINWNEVFKKPISNIQRGNTLMAKVYFSLNEEGAIKVNQIISTYPEIETYIKSQLEQMVLNVDSTQLKANEPYSQTIYITVQ